MGKQDVTTSKEAKKSTNLAKFLRVLRITHDELLGDMAEKLGIKPSYLSSIEANRRPLTDELKARLVAAYNLAGEDLQKLDNSIAEANRTVEVNLTAVQDEALLPEYVDTALLFACDLSKMSKLELAEIKNLLQGFRKEGRYNEKAGGAKNTAATHARV